VAVVVVVEEEEEEEEEERRVSVVYSSGLSVRSVRRSAPPTTCLAT
jgi:hypothetical protein